MPDELLSVSGSQAWHLVFAIFIIGAIGGLAAMVPGLQALARFTGTVASVTGGVLLCLISAATLVSGVPLTWSVPSGLPYAECSFRVDPLSAVFTMALGFVAAATGLYAYGYTEQLTIRRSGILGFFVSILLLSLCVVFTAANVLLFLIAWEVMALAAFCLVSFDHHHVETREAGILFFVMSHVGTGFLMIAFLLLGTWSNSFEFRNFQAQTDPWRFGILFLFFLVGFGVKAGIVPLHIWLPAAHPVCPSHVSALMSGIVVKTGVYGLLRVSLEFLGLPPAWAALLVLAVGISTSLLAVLYALIETDLKRLLAYSTIENVGIILIGLGATMLFFKLGKPALGAISLAGSLAHILNHALFKALLFLGAGSVLHGAHTRNLERMGGLIRGMPATAALFLVGSIAIAGLPPLNGFLSEWLIYQSLLSGFGATPAITRLLFPVAGALLALTGALAAAAFVKAFGIAFLGLPRSDKSQQARESHWTMLAGMGSLALGCLVAGLFGPRLLPAIDSVTWQFLREQPSAMLLTAGPYTLSSGISRGGAVSNLALAALLTVLIVAIILLLAGARAKSRRGATWDCGLPELREYNEFTATAFSKPIRMVFGALFQPTRSIQAQFDVSPYFPKSVAFASEVERTFEERLYRPIKNTLFGIAASSRLVQAGSLHAYLAYIFVVLVALLLFGVRP